MWATGLGVLQLAPIRAKLRRFLLKLLQYGTIQRQWVTTGHERRDIQVAVERTREENRFNSKSEALKAMRFAGPPELWVFDSRWRRSAPAPGDTI